MSYKDRLKQIQDNREYESIYKRSGELNQSLNKDEREKRLLEDSINIAPFLFNKDVKNDYKENQNKDFNEKKPSVIKDYDIDEMAKAYKPIKEKEWGQNLLNNYQNESEQDLERAEQNDIDERNSEEINYGRELGKDAMKVGLHVLPYTNPIASKVVNTANRALSFKDRIKKVKEQNEKYKDVDSSTWKKVGNTISGATRTTMNTVAPALDFMKANISGLGRSAYDRNDNEGFKENYKQGFNDYYKYSKEEEDKEKEQAGDIGRYAIEAADYVGGLYRNIKQMGGVEIANNFLEDYNNAKKGNGGQELNKKQIFSLANNAVTDTILNQDRKESSELQKRLTNENKRRENLANTQENKRIAKANSEYNNDIEKLQDGTKKDTNINLNDYADSRVAKINDYKNNDTTTPEMIKQREQQEKIQNIKNKFNYGKNEVNKGLNKGLNKVKNAIRKVDTNRIKPESAEDTINRDNPMPTRTQNKDVDNIVETQQNDTNFKNNVKNWQPGTFKKDNEKVAKEYYREYYDEKDKSLLSKTVQGGIKALSSFRIPLGVGTIKPFIFLEAFKKPEISQSKNARERTLVKNQMMGGKADFESIVKPYYAKMQQAGIDLPSILGLRNFMKKYQSIQDSNSPDIKQAIAELHGTSSIPDLEKNYTKLFDGYTAKDVIKYTELMNDIVDSSMIGARMNKPAYKLDTGKLNTQLRVADNLEERVAPINKFQDRIKQLKNGEVIEKKKADWKNRLQAKREEIVNNAIKSKEERAQADFDKESKQLLADEQDDLYRQHKETEKGLLTSDEVQQRQNQVNGLKQRFNMTQQNEQTLNQKENTAKNRLQTILNDRRTKEIDQKADIIIKSAIEQNIDPRQSQELKDLGLNSEQIQFKYDQQLKKVKEEQDRKEQAQKVFDKTPEGQRLLKEKADKEKAEKEQKIALENQQKQEKADKEKGLDKLINSYLDNKQNPIKLAEELEQKGYKQDEINQSIDRVTKDRKAQRDRAKAVSDELNNNDTLSNELEELDFDFDQVNPHIGIGGISGSGKTNFIKHVVNKLEKQDPEQEIFIIDPKTNQFLNYKNKPNIKVFDRDDVTAKEDNAFIRGIAIAKTQIPKRNAQIKSLGADDMEEYNKRAKEKGLPLMHPLTLIVDEYTELSGKKLKIEVGTKMQENLYGQMQLTDANKLDLEEVLESIVKTGRSVGVRLIVADQAIGDIPERITRNLKTNYVTKSIDLNKKTAPLLTEEGKKNIPDNVNPIYNKDIGEITKIHNNTYKKFKINAVKKD
jgi:hypothetical protein